METKTINKILIANRGEIASRIIKTIHEMGKVAVAVCTDYDSTLPFVSEADESYSLGKGDLADSYLNARKLIQIAQLAGAEAIHPGYGFLSENPDFARLCKENKLTFIGPSEDVIRLMGNKVMARKLAEEAGIPVLPGRTGTVKEILAQSSQLKFPVLVKPADGGGGKGMRLVSAESELRDALNATAREALSYFGSAEVFVEHYISEPRHIEVQVLGDEHGNLVHLFERECSLQRRYQKIIEEAPSPSISEDQREQLTGYALLLAEKIGYTSAGTVEFLLDQEGKIYFLEMNTRIQVEHPVSESITGVDIVREQIRIAQGQALSVKQSDFQAIGHSIEARIYAEDPNQDFRPSTGKIIALDLPSYTWCRIDNGYLADDMVNPWYDPMLSKVIVSGRNRDEARNHMVNALREFHIAGVHTNRDYLLEILLNDDYRENKIHTGWIDSQKGMLTEKSEKRKAGYPRVELIAAAVMASLNKRNDAKNDSVWSLAGYWRLLPEIILDIDNVQQRLSYEPTGRTGEIKVKQEDGWLYIKLEHHSEQHYRISLGEHRISFWALLDRSDIHIDISGMRFELRRPDVPDTRYITSGSSSSTVKQNEILAPLPGKVVEIMVNEGQKVQKGEVVILIESMKMENRIVATREGIVKKVYVDKGEQTDKNKLLILLE